ncbi:hypothetical protein FIBSPDRAFT_430113 [Athelia psychrophila]|uniref:Uncharacterized protein n=1 Tax=Athelia psychrophila TaxID=1759441 RepID=A0A166MLE5_9AGAM|nr:hypothetical protein FIBSPDRAFT_430113 [Fibularhizoctonia sp. CBS 109695]
MKVFALLFLSIGASAACIPCSSRSASPTSPAHGPHSSPSAPTPAASVARSNPSATLMPFLAPLCQITDPIFSLLCKFPTQTLSPGVCTEVTTPCVVHGPASFEAHFGSVTQEGCRVTVFSNSGCSGEEVESGEVSATGPGTCIESPFLGSALNGGEASSSLLPFGFKSSRLDCY